MGPIDLSGIWYGFVAALIVCAIAVPLAVWKLIELVAWLVSHVRIV